MLAVAIAPYATWLATTSYDGTARIWDPATGARVASPRVAGPLVHLEWSGGTLVAAGAFGPYTFRFVCRPDDAVEQSHDRRGKLEKPGMMTSLVASVLAASRPALSADWIDQASPFAGHHRRCWQPMLNDADRCRAVW